MSNVRDRKFNNEEEARLRRAGEEFSRRMKTNYPPEYDVAMGIVLPNLMKGCPWGITTGKNLAFMKNINAFIPKAGDSRRVVSAYKLSRMKGRESEDRYLVMVSFDVFINILNKEGGGVFDRRDLEHAKKKRTDALNELVKFLKAGKIGTIGIFNTNEDHCIVADGVEYPAFSVTLVELLSYCSLLGYGLMVLGNKISTTVALNNIEKLYETLQPAPNGHALMISITR